MALKTRKTSRRKQSLKAARKIKPVDRIAVPLPSNVLKGIDSRAESEGITRDELILRAINSFLKPHLDIRKGADKVTQAISVPNERFKTGRYDP